MRAINNGYTAWWAVAVGVALLCSAVMSRAAAAGGIPVDEEVLVVDPGNLPGDQYGYSVAFDGTTLLIGSPSATSDVDGSVGLVQIYQWNGHDMEPVAELSTGPGDLMTQFGASVAVDGGTIVVGAPSARLGPNRPGKIYVYSIAEDTISLEGEFTSSSAEDDGDGFGACVAVSGDIIIAGAPYDSIDFANQGSVTTFDGVSGAWIEDVILASSIPVLDGGFGFAVDFDGSRAVIGEPAGTSSAGQANVGGADVFQYVPGNWTHESRLDPNETDADSQFGAAVSIDSTLVAVGAPSQNGGTGHITVFFYSSTGGWNAQALTLPADCVIGDGLGTSVAVSGSRIYVGSPWGNGYGADTGCVHVFSLVSDYEETHRLVASFLAGADQAAVGWSIGVSGTDVIIGAPAYNGSTGLTLFYGNYNYWNASESGDWFNPANWTSGAIPDADTPVLFGVSASLDVAVDKAAMCASLDVYDGDIMFQFDEFGGSLEVEGNDGMIIGSTSSATLETNEGVIDVVSSLQIGRDPGVTGILSLNGTEMEVQDSILVGVNGTGLLGLESDATLLGINMTLAGTSNSTLVISDNAVLQLLPQNANAFGLEILTGRVSLEGGSGELAADHAGVLVEAGSFLGGAGLVTGNIVNRGVVSAEPEDSTTSGVLTIDGNFDTLSTGGAGIVAGRTWVYWSGPYNGYVDITGTATLGGPMSIEIPDGLTSPGPGTSVPLLSGLVLEDDFSTYFVPGFEGNDWFDIQRTAGLRGGESITAELDSLPIPFGFNDPVDGPVGEGDAVSIKVFDVNGDFVDDVVVLVHDPLAEDAVVIYRNTNGTLCFFDRVGVGEDPSDFTVADFDDDGDADMAVTSRSLDQTRILVNDGFGGYTIILDLAAEIDPSALCVFNYNGDPKPDLAVVNEGSNSMQVFPNTSSSALRSVGFGSPYLYTTGLAPSGVQPGQTGGTSGKEDDIVVANADGTVSVFLNAGGSFPPATAHSFDGSPVNGLSVVDLDLDGTDDIMVTLSPTGVGILYGPPGSTPADILEVTGSGILQVDLDLDGDDDGVIDQPPPGLRGSQPLQIIRNDSDLQDGGEVVLADVPLGAFGGSSLTSSGDIDDEGNPDLVHVTGTAPGAFTLSVSTSDREGAPPWAPGKCCLADTDGDGMVDVNDILAALSAWGPCTGCPEDINDDGVVDVDDVLAILSSWGDC